MEYVLVGMTGLNIIISSSIPIIIGIGYFIKHISKSECFVGKNSKFKVELRPPTPPTNTPINNVI
jgi:hypothetical protein